jgi:hypothetical protein
MSSRFTFAHYLLGGGIALGLLGLILWWALPIASSLPPFCFTALLAIAFGVWQLVRSRRP